MYSKFSSTDRKLVIEEMERIQQTKLRSVNSSRKLFVDSKNMYYYIFGGSDNWHGIRKNIISELAQYKQEGAFIVVKKYESRMDICVGSLQLFIQNMSKLKPTSQGDFQFHTIVLEDGMYLLEIPELVLNKVSEIQFKNYRRDFSKLETISKIINIEIDTTEKQLTHYDLQAKLVLIGSYLGYRTYVAEPDKGRNTMFGKKLGELASEANIPEGSIPALSMETIKYVDVIWFDDEGYPTHVFEVEHTTDITKGLLRLYQIHKLKVKMFIISNQKEKFDKEINKSPFHKIREEFIFKNYDELDEFFESVKSFTKIQEKFLSRGSNI